MTKHVQHRSVILVIPQMTSEESDVVEPPPLAQQQQAEEWHHERRHMTVEPQFHALSDSYPTPNVGFVPETDEWELRLYNMCSR